MYSLVLIPPLVLLIGAIALVVVFGVSRHWRTALLNALINATLTVGLAYLLLLGTLGIVTWALYPGVLAVFLAAGSKSHATDLANLNKPPQYVRLYPTNKLSLLLTVCFAVVAAQRACVWRDEAELEVSKLVDPMAVLDVAEKSPRARAYMKEYFAQNRREEIASKDLIQVCGSVLRLAELDGARATLPHPADQICRSSNTYSQKK